MSNPRTNRGRPTKAVYRRRQLIALGVVVLLGWLIWVLISSLFAFVAGLINPQGPEDGVTPQAGASCAPGVITIAPIVANSAGSEQSSFSLDSYPYFGYKLTNTSSVDCTFDVGPLVTQYTVTSGDQTIWDSSQCFATGLTNQVVTVPKGETLTSPLGIWYRVYSSETGCGAEQDVVTAGGASYHLKVTVNGVISQNTSQFILQ
ncbi:MAG: hypothetical protein RI933_7 [Actinomycetota bacterium]|jgi:hypothetical protein|uniref:DUF4232 domain-containing protein n=1 Tax=Candidatus Rhodoluna planktonica TaxID=535712 RepID=A0A1D9DXN7_9MICO|nr:hypothetical protein [Candidatus Rhodoluna planktonica]AOY55571.1 hypothetical protein A4Z71_00705 [Candidatus Rhodoluna planktonica]